MKEKAKRKEKKKKKKRKGQEKVIRFLTEILQFHFLPKITSRWKHRFGASEKKKEKKRTFHLIR